jgi:hypothetical protein
VSKQKEQQKLKEKTNKYNKQQWEREEQRNWL